VVRATTNGADQSWWDWWRRKPASTTPTPTVHLESRISGHVVEAEVPLQPDGRFEVALTGDLPVARRGWRIARNRVTCLGRTAEKCSVILMPPESARAAAVVLLPLAYTLEADGAQRLTLCEAASRLTPVLRQLQQGPGGPHALYYVGGVSTTGAVPQAQLALATTTLGWPSGNFILLSSLPQTAADTLAAGLDRLRWLLAGALELLVMNLEPAFTPVCAGLLEAKPDRALVPRVVKPEDAPWTVFPDTPADLPRPHIFAPRPTRAGLVPRHPVVFCHGMLAFTTLSMSLPEDFNYFVHLRGFLRDRGFRALFPKVTPTGGIVARAEQLREQITCWTDEPVNIIAHSMGGLDARYLITHLGMADRVRSLTTIATPHRGSQLLEWFVANFGQRVPLLLAMEALGLNVDGFQDCRPGACQEFNARTPDMPGVKYFSYGGAVPASRIAPVLRRAWSLVNAAEGPNDGMVSVASARWGEYLGTLCADHFAQTPDMMLVHPGESFDPLGFYFRLLEDLARRGF
jgi:triacylglycerol lipase